MKTSKAVLFIATILMLVVPAMAVDLYVGGTYIDAKTESPTRDAWGGEAEARIPIGSGFQAGFGVGGQLWNLRATDPATNGNVSTAVSGNVKAIPLTASVLWGTEVGAGISILGQIGVAYNHMDYDIHAHATQRSGEWTRTVASNNDYNAGNIWTAPALLYVTVPLGAETTLLSLGGGYQWQLNAYNHGRFAEGFIAKLGIVQRFN